jgi:hypothetical protein
MITKKEGKEKKWRERITKKEGKDNKKGGKG